MRVERLDEAIILHLRPYSGSHGPYSWVYGYRRLDNDFDEDAYMPMNRRITSDDIQVNPRILEEGNAPVYRNAPSTGDHDYESFSVVDETTSVKMVDVKNTCER
jgi:hypothetical protein